MQEKNNYTRAKRTQRTKLIVTILYVLILFAGGVVEFEVYALFNEENCYGNCTQRPRRDTEPETGDSDSDSSPGEPSSEGGERGAADLSDTYTDEGGEISNYTDGTEDNKNNDNQRTQDYTGGEAATNNNTSRSDTDGDPVIITTGDWSHSEEDIGYEYYGLEVASTRRYGEEITGGVLGEQYAWSFDSRIVVGGEVVDKHYKHSDELQKVIDAYNKTLHELPGVIFEISQFLKPGAVLTDLSWSTNYRSVATGYLSEEDYTALEAKRDRYQAKLSHIQAQIQEQEAKRAQALLEEAYRAQMRVQNQYHERGGVENNWEYLAQEYVTLIDRKGVPHTYRNPNTIYYEATDLDGDGQKDYYGTSIEYEAEDKDNRNTLEYNSGSYSYREWGSGEVWKYDWYGRLTSIEDRNGNKVGISYSPDGKQVVKVATETSNQWLAISYTSVDGVKRINRIADDTGRNVDYEYDTTHNLSKITDLGGIVTKYKNDSTGAIQKIIKMDGSEIQMVYGTRSYDNKQVITSTIDEEGNQEYFSYEEGKTTYTDHSGDVKEYYYNARQQTTKEVWMDATNAIRTKTYSYNSDGRIVQEHEEDNLSGSTNRVEYTYDSEGAIRSQTLFVDGVELYEETWDYGGDDLVDRYSNGEGGILSFSYDPTGNLVQITGGIAGTVRYTRNNKGQITNYKEGSYEWEYEYDNAGRVVKIKDEEGREVGYSYNASGQIAEKTWNDAEGNLWGSEAYTLRADGLRTAVQRRNSQGEEVGIEYYEYNNRGDMVAYTDSGGQRHVLSYDKRHKMEQIVAGEDRARAVAYKYRPDGNIAEKRSMGIRKEYEYSSHNRIESIHYRGEGSKEEYRITYKRDGRGYIEEAEGGGGEVLGKYERDGLGRVVEAEDGEENIRRYSYRQLAQGSEAIIAVSNRKGSVEYQEKIVYDEWGRVVSVQRGEGADEEGITYSYAWNNEGYTVTETQGRRVRTDTYDSYGRLKQEVRSNGVRYSYEYTPQGALAEVQENDVVRARYEYDSYGNRISEEDSLGNEVSYSYTKWGEIASYTNEAEGEYQYEYNSKRDLIGITQPNGGRWQYEYTQYGQREKAIDPEGRWKEYEYDWQGRVVSIRDGGGVVRKASYDWRGNVIEEEGLRGIWKYRYDSQGRVIAEEDGEGNIWQRAYTALGATKSSTDPDGNSYEWEYNSAGRMTGEINQLGNRQSYEYSKGLLEKVESFRGERIDYEYRGGQLSKITYDEEAIEYGYNAQGLLNRVARGDHWLHYGYDSKGQMTESSSSDMGTIRYTYDSMGNIQSQDQGGVVEQRQYTTMGILSRIEYGDGSWDSYEYDLSGRKQSNRSANGRVRAWGYDGGGRLSYWKETEEGQRDEGIGEGYVYDELGRVVAKVNYQGQASLYEYDEAGRLRSSKEPFSEERASQAYERYLEAGYFPDTESTSAGYTVEGESYREVVTRLGQRYKDKRMEESTMKRGRGATPFARMLRMGAHSSSIQAVFSSMKGNVGVPSGQSVWSEEYEYDRRGNMVGQQNGWGSIAMEYDNANRMTRRGRRSYEYDKAGNITQETLYEVAIQYTYSGDNRVRSMHANKQGVIGAGQTIEYQYDGLGRRRMSSYTNEDHRREEVRQSYEQRSVRVASEWIRIGYEADEAARTPHYMPLVAIPEGTWYRVPDSAKEAKVMMKRRYSYGQDGELTYAYSHVPQYQGGEKNLEHFGSVYYTTDVLGSVRGISNEEGTVASIYEYSAFGDLYQGDSTLSYGMAYTGKQEMRGLEGIYNYGYRDYRAVEGRFSTEDPIKDGTNWYVYVGNSPLNFVDPLGLYDIAIAKAPNKNLVDYIDSGGGNNDYIDYDEVDANVEEAKNMTNKEWYNSVRNKGKWDYKQKDSKLENMGNFNYGATGRAKGIPRGVLLRGAGWAQRKAGTSKKGSGKWYGKSPYGDDPKDQKYIKNGMDYYDKTYKKKEGY